MFARLRLTLSVFVVLGILAACAPAPTPSVATQLPSEAVEPTSPPPPTNSVQPSPVPLGFDCQAVQEISVEECEGLAALYASTGGDEWADHSGWLTNHTPCEWYGVICQQGHVVELQLFYNELSGTLPVELGNLSHLQSLYLDDNQLSGPLPAEVGNLTELQIARLGGNQFSTIPVELTSLEHLLTLEVWGNQLSGEIPAEIGSLSNLQELNLSSNQFTGSMPPELGELAFLHNLNLSHNQLSGSIPAELGELLNLNQLDLSYNQLTGSIPLELANLPQLYWLDLSYNELTGAVPHSIASAPMSERRLWGNLFEGTILISDRASTTVDSNGIHFELDSSLAASLWPERVPAFEPDPNAPGWLAWPDHLRFTMAYPRKPDGSVTGKSTAFGPPQILIYPTETFSTTSEFARTEIEELQALLEARPPVIENEIPLLPLINAAQVFHAQVEYLEFQNGDGVRFITQYSQDLGPVTNQNIFYTFQGLTSDGAYYVAAHFPVAAAGLDDEPPVIEDMDAFGAGYRDYLAETVEHLDTLSADEFAPDLGLLDQVIQSLQVETP